MMTPAFRDFYNSMLETVGALIKLDPPADSPEGRLLLGLATALEEFEKVKFPLGKPPSYTCPRCHLVSYNPNDIKERYCGRCHEFESP
jgi:hypothetical protein